MNMLDKKWLVMSIWLHFIIKIYGLKVLGITEKDIELKKYHLRKLINLKNKYYSKFYYNIYSNFMYI